MAKDKLIPGDFLDPEDIENLTSADKKIPGKVLKSGSKEIKKVEDAPAFDEEFDYDDVAGIPKPNSEETDALDDDQSDDDNLDSYVPYDDQNRLKESFEEFIERDDDFDLAREQALKTKFKDYLKAPNISGKARGISGTNRIPSEAVEQSKEILEIEIDESQKKSDKKHRSTIITHKSADDVIEYIEVICSCGNKTAIKLDYGEQEDFGVFKDTLKESSEEMFDEEDQEEFAVDSDETTEEGDSNSDSREITDEDVEIESETDIFDEIESEDSSENDQTDGEEEKE